MDVAINLHHQLTRQHDIRCMCIASQGSKASFAVESGRVITGSAEGEIFMWRTEKRRSDGSLVILPSCLLTGGRGASRAPVVAVVAALRENAEEVVISVSVDGSISQWLVQNGRCVATRGRAIQQTFSLCGGRNRCVAVTVGERMDQVAIASGEGPWIDIIGVQCMRVLQRLRMRGPWICRLLSSTLAMESDDDAATPDAYKLLSADRAGNMMLWKELANRYDGPVWKPELSWAIDMPKATSLKEADEEKTSTEIEAETGAKAALEPRWVIDVVASSGQEHFAILCPNAVGLVSKQQLQCHGSKIRPHYVSLPGAWLSAAFAGVTALLLWDSTGKIRHYNIASGSALHLVGTYHHTNPDCRLIPLACVVSMPTRAPGFGDASTRQLRLLQPCYNPSPNQWTADATARTFPYRTTASLAMWEVDESAEAEAGGPARPLPMHSPPAAPAPSRAASFEMKTSEGEGGAEAVRGERQCTCSTLLLYGDDGDVELCEPFPSLVARGYTDNTVELSPLMRPYSCLSTPSANGGSELSVLRFRLRVDTWERDQDGGDGDGGDGLGDHAAAVTALKFCRVPVGYGWVPKEMDGASRHGVCLLCGDAVGVVSAWEVYWEPSPPPATHPPPSGGGEPARRTGLLSPAFPNMRLTAVRLACWRRHVGPVVAFSIQPLLNKRAWTQLPNDSKSASTKATGHTPEVMGCSVGSDGSVTLLVLQRQANVTGCAGRTTARRMPTATTCFSWDAAPDARPRYDSILDPAARPTRCLIVGRVGHVLRGHRGPVISITWQPVAKQLLVLVASSSMQFSVGLAAHTQYVWDLATGRLQRRTVPAARALEQGGNSLHNKYFSATSAVWDLGQSLPMSGADHGLAAAEAQARDYYHRTHQMKSSSSSTPDKEQPSSLEFGLASRLGAPAHLQRMPHPLRGTIGLVGDPPELRRLGRSCTYDASDGSDQRHGMVTTINRKLGESCRAATLEDANPENEEAAAALHQFGYGLGGRLDARWRGSCRLYGTMAAWAHAESEAAIVFKTKAIAMNLLHALTLYTLVRNRIKESQPKTESDLPPSAATAQALAAQVVATKSMLDQAMRMVQLQMSFMLGFERGSDEYEEAASSGSEDESAESKSRQAEKVLNCPLQLASDGADPGIGDVLFSLVSDRAMSPPPQTVAKGGSHFGVGHTGHGPMQREAKAADTLTPQHSRYGGSSPDTSSADKRKSQSSRGQTPLQPSQESPEDATGSGHGFSMVVPFAVQQSRSRTQRTDYRWCHSGRLTAEHTTSIVSLLFVLINIAENLHNEPAQVRHSAHFLPPLSQLVAYFSVTLPDLLTPPTVSPQHAIWRQPSYKEAPTLLLAGVGIDTWTECQATARLLLKATVDRMSKETRFYTATKLAGQLRNIDRQHSESPNRKLFSSDSEDHLSKDDFRRITPMEYLLVFIFSIIGQVSPEYIQAVTAMHITSVLSRILVQSRSVVQISFAAEQLGKGFGMWQPHLQERHLILLIKRLLMLTLSTPGNIHPGRHQAASPEAVYRMQRELLVSQCATSVASTAQRSLFQVGQLEPKFFAETVGKEVLRADCSPKYHCTALMALVSLVNHNPDALMRLIPRVVEIVVRALDPASPERRRGCLKASTRALKDIGRKYPVVSFHQSTQRYAVGTDGGPIVIYDLRTAIKWRVLQGHRGPISVTHFNAAGDVLVSYSSIDGTVRSWKTGNSGFFSGLGMQIRRARTVKVKKIPRSKATNERRCNIKWTSDREVLLTRENESKIVVKVL